MSLFEFIDQHEYCITLQSQNDNKVKFQFKYTVKVFKIQCFCSNISFYDKKEKKLNM